MSEPSIDRAVILAAGLGTRLRPLTDRLPKPLVPVLGRPLLDHIVERLADAGVRDLLLNTHHLPGAIRAWADARTGSPRTELSHEPAILGTGGALANVRERLRDGGAFLLHNGDVWTDADFSALAREHAEHGAEITLLLTDWPPVNSVSLRAAGEVRDIGGCLGSAERPGDRPLTYTGVAMISPVFLDRLPVGPGSLAAAMIEAVTETPGSVRGYAPEGLTWSDLGTPARYLRLHAELLAREPRILRGRDVRCDETARLAGFCVLGDRCVVGKQVSLSDCIVLAGTRVDGPASHHRAVLGAGWVMAEGGRDPAPDKPLRSFLAEAGFAAAVAFPLSTQGSDRRFWRCRSGDSSAVLMDSRGDPAEYARGLAIMDFLYAAGLGGVRVLARHESRPFALLEDCGDETLREHLRSHPGSWRDFYRRVLSLLADLQHDGTSTALAGACREACDRCFGVPELLAETAYFRRRFLTEHCGMNDARLAGLDREFAGLAELVAAQPAVLMHRDFQSTNILFHSSGVRLIDVQGMRLGPRGYDVASLLRDPYVDLPGDRVATLIDDWCAEKASRDAATDPAVLRREIVLAGLQRSMQALGAYAFLSRIKGRRDFARWFAPGLAQLAAGLAAADSLSGVPAMPVLAAIVAELMADDTQDI